MFVSALLSYIVGLEGKIYQKEFDCDIDDVKSQ